MRQHVKRIGNRRDPRCFRDRYPLQFLWITFAVPSLAMRIGNIFCKIKRRVVGLLQNLSSDLGVFAHHLCLGGAQRLRSCQQCTRKTQLADIVQACS